MIKKCDLSIDDEYEYIGNGIERANVYDGDGELAAYIFRGENWNESIEDVSKRINNGYPFELK